jgi:hypothetical protein
MKEFAATLNLKIEVIIKANNRDEALSFFDDLFPNITIDNCGEKDIEIVDDNLEAIGADNDWELED